MRQQEPPFTIKVEMTEGCNLRCTFCGLQGIRAPGVKDYKFMTTETARSLADQIRALGWQSRFEFALRGEPTMNPDCAAIIDAFRRSLPRASLMMTSNGGGLLASPGPSERVRALFDAGLNVLCLDDYQGVGIVPKILSKLDGTPQVVHYPDDKSGNPYKRHPARKRMITVFRDISIPQNGVHNHLSNHCGAAAPPNDSCAGKRCARPFRELAIRYDGQVMLCCNDWRGTYVVGSALAENGLRDCWQSAAMDAARRRLYRGLRDFGPCAGCDSRSHRSGLLPDPAGRHEMPPPDDDSAAAIVRATSQEPMTKPHLREWEIG